VILKSLFFFNKLVQTVKKIIMKYFIGTVFVLLSFISYSQDYVKIYGFVKNFKTNKPLQYVNIYFDRNNTGTITNSKGEYILTVKKENLPDTLIFSYIGYQGEIFFIDGSKRKYELNVNLKHKINEINTVKICAKRPDPAEILKKTYEFLKKHNNKIFKVEHYARLYLKYNDKFIYAAKGFFSGYMGNKVDLWENNKLISRNIMTNDSLLYSLSVPEVLFLAMNSKQSVNKIHRLLRNGDIQIDTVIFYAKSKLYVLNVNYNFKSTLPSNYDMIVTPGLTKTVLTQIKDTTEKRKSYKIYTEVTGDNYILKKMERIETVFSPSAEYDFYLYKKEYNYKVLDDNSIIPNHQSCFEAYISDTANYYIYNNYVITKFDTAGSVDETYTSIDFSFPIYDKIVIDHARKKNKLDKAKSELKKMIGNNNAPGLNYIKQDTLEYLINRDLK